MPKFTSETGRIAGKKSKRPSTKELRQLLKIKLCSLDKETKNAVLENIDDGLKESVETIGDAVSAVLIQEALKGNIAAHREINDRIDGKAKKRIVQTQTNNVIFYLPEPKA